MVRKNQLLREAGVFRPEDFSFVKDVLEFLRKYGLDSKAELVGSALTDHFKGGEKTYRDIDMLIRWGIYDERKALQAIRDLEKEKHPKRWCVEHTHNREFISGYGGVEKITDRFELSPRKGKPGYISISQARPVDLIFAAEREFMSETIGFERGRRLVPLR